MYTLSSSPLHTRQDSQSSLVVSRQTDLNTETSTSNRYEVFLQILVESSWNIGTQIKTFLDS
jgi:hypothetical protein